MVFRSDESGNSDNFQKYLDTASNGAWGRGAGKVFKGGVGEGAMGNDGTAAAVKRTEGAISYNEWSFAQAQQLRRGQDHHVGRSGPSRDQCGFGGQDDCLGRGSSTRTTTWFSTRSRSTGRRQPGSYPIVLATYEIVCSKYPDAQAGTAVKAFLQSTIGAGQNGLADNGYIPIPDAFKSRLSTAVNAIS